ncbi:hypothetical protein AHAS_Ahas11G0271100 [Arachis hypogaea]
MQRIDKQIEQGEMDECSLARSRALQVLAERWIVTMFFTDGILPKEANLTWVALAHKEGGKDDLGNYRLIREAQSTFVEGRKIMDGALIACKIVH